MIRLTGFGPFRDVVDNPSATLVRALAGRTVAGHRIEARVLPVRWRGGLDGALRGARADLLLGFGVAVARDRITVEAGGTPVREGLDIDGASPPPSPDGPARVAATIDPARLAGLLDGDVSDDAGTYLCNAWAWSVVQAAGCPAAFVHLPSTGAEPARVLRALDALLSTQKTV